MSTRWRLVGLTPTANAGQVPATVLEKLDPGTGYYVELRGDMHASLTTGTWDMTAYPFAVGVASATSAATMVALE